MAHPQELEQFSLLIVGNLYRLTYFRDFYNQVLQGLCHDCFAHSYTVARPLF